MSRLTINKDGTPRVHDVDFVIHELEDSRIRRQILSARIIDMQVSGDGPKNTNCRVLYKNQAIIIPISEMGIELANNDGDEWTRKVQILSTMIGAEIDFIVRGMDTKDPNNIIVIASRADALRKKRHEYFLSDNPILTDEYDEAEARVLAVAEQSARLEICGVEVTLPMKDLFWEWCTDVRERLNPGDVIPVKILEKKIEGKDIQLSVSAKEAMPNTVAIALEKIHIGDKCLGEVTRIAENQPIFIHLKNGANAIAHNSRVNTAAFPGDIVYLAINQINEEKQTAVGVITRVIHQNRGF